MTKRIGILLGVAVFIIAVLAIFLLAKPAAELITPPKPTQVTVAPVSKNKMPMTVTALGTVIAPQTVMLRAKVEGLVESVHFTSGAPVKKGDLLVQMQQQAQQAVVMEKEARVVQMKADFERYNSLYQHDREDLVLQQYDQAKADYDAAVSELRAAQQALNDTQIIAPFSGYIGTLQSVADSVGNGNTMVNTLSEITVGSYLKSGDPIALLSNPEMTVVQYQVPEEYSQWLAVGQAVTFISSAYPNKLFHGTVTFISPVVYQSSRAFDVRAQLENPDHALKSGMTVIAKQVLVEDRVVLTVPGLNLVPSFTGYEVYTIAQGKILPIPVEVGERFNTQVEILKGLHEGDQIITSDVSKLHPGEMVEVIA